MVELAEWIRSAGVWAYVLAPVVMAAVAILPVPAESPALLNGVLFGPWLGTLVSWCGAMAGAWISFELSRAYGRPIAQRWIGTSTLDRVDRATLGVGWSGLLALRLIPWVAFTALNWGLGLGPVARKRFLWTTAVGIAPGALLFTTTGAGLGYLWGRVGVGGWLIIALAVALAVLLTRRRRHLRRSAETDAPERSNS